LSNRLWEASPEAIAEMLRQMPDDLLGSLIEASLTLSHPLSEASSVEINKMLRQMPDDVLGSLIKASLIALQPIPAPNISDNLLCPLPAPEIEMRSL
jgi:hypothetical protein